LTRLPPYLNSVGQVEIERKKSDLSKMKVCKYIESTKSYLAMIYLYIYIYDY